MKGTSKRFDAKCKTLKLFQQRIYLKIFGKKGLIINLRLHHVKFEHNTIPLQNINIYKVGLMLNGVKIKCRLVIFYEQNKMILQKCITTKLNHIH